MEPENAAPARRRIRFFGRSQDPETEHSGTRPKPSKWSMGILNDPDTVEVPGSVLLLAAHRNEPLGLRNLNARTSHSSIPAGFHVDVPASPGSGNHSRRPSYHRGASHGEPTSPPPQVVSQPQQPSDGLAAGDKKTTTDGAIILEPQPDDSANDPLNWPSWKRDAALLSLGLYCMIGGGITPIIAAGFTDVAHTYGLHTEEVALTTGLYMMGLGVGSVLFSPTAILFGKRPVYLFSAVVFIGTSLWCGFSPSFTSLLVARVFQGIAVSPVECLPSATIAEIFFLHERAYRIGIYTLLLLGGKNLVPLVSAAIIGRWGWRWVFWITAMVAALGFFLLFFFVPETFWDRTPTRKPHKRPSFLRRLSSRQGTATPQHPMAQRSDSQVDPLVSGGAGGRHKDLHVGFASDSEEQQTQELPPTATPAAAGTQAQNNNSVFTTAAPDEAQLSEKQGTTPAPAATNDVLNSRPDTGDRRSSTTADPYTGSPALEKVTDQNFQGPPKSQAYTHNLRQQPPRSFAQQLRPYNGRLNNDKWFKVMLRPFVLFAYPAVLWSSIVYACSVGWLIVISETMAIIYRDPDLYNFDALQTGLVYISPFIGGILGTGVAGKISDIIVKIMAKRNGGMYEPEFRLVMAIPILLTTCIGLMGFGWSAEEGDHWIVPTLFFGVMSFGCSLGSTTSITFCVDSYRQYAGEALVTLNFSKNILHGLVFSLFVTNWLASDGAKAVFLWIGIIQLILMLLTIPMYIYGKRARMWTARMNLMERL